MRRELRRVDEDRRDDELRMRAADVEQADVSGVQGAHRRDAADASPLRSGVFDGCPQFADVGRDLHGCDRWCSAFRLFSREKTVWHAVTCSSMNTNGYRILRSGSSCLIPASSGILSGTAPVRFSSESIKRAELSDS